MKKISVIGTGSFGTSLAMLLSDNNNAVLMYGKTENTVNEINNKHTNERYLKNISIGDNVKATTNLEETVNYSDYILLAVPSSAVRKVVGEIDKLIKSPKVIINVAKGLEPETFKTISEIVEEEFSPQNLKAFVGITGPSHAEEVAQKMLTALLCFSEDTEEVVNVQNLFNNQDYFRVYRGSDLIGAQICGAVKNVIAIAAGAIDGLGFGDNTKAALITRGLHEMKKIVVEFGGEESTVNGLSGIGDLIVTANSKHSRNWNMGYRLGKGESTDEILDSMTMVVEGVRTCKAIVGIARKRGIEIPICEAVYEVLFNNVSPKDGIKTLMTRDLREE